jgi:hypothetical protein
LAILFVSLGLGYSFLTPIFENSDETLHYPYAKHLADGWGLPLAIAGQLWNQEGTQPPLYYALVAASTFWLDTDNLPHLLQRNPHWLFTEVRALINDNQNLVLHGPMDAFPYRRAALAVHIGRWWSLLFGLLTVIFTFWLTRRLFPTNLPLALTATALTALNPQFLRVSATLSNDSLSSALTALTVLLAFRFTEHNCFSITKGQGSRGAEGQRRFHPCSPAPLLLGLLAGLAILTKLSALSVLLVVGFIVFLRLYFISEIHQDPFRQTVKWLAIIVVTALVVTGWWFWRNYSLYGEWFATDTHLNLAGRNHLGLGEVWALRAEAERAYWATFGWGQIRPPEWVFQLLFWFTRLGLLGLLLALVAKLVQGDQSRPLPLSLTSIHFSKIFVLLLWAGLNLVLYGRWLMEVGSVSHTRLVFPAIAAISMLLALGWHALVPARLGGWLSSGIVIALLGLNLYSLGWLIYPAFRPSESPGQQPPGTSLSTVNLTFLDSLKLAGGYVEAMASSQPQARPGEVVAVHAWWQPLAPLDKNYSIAAVLLAPDGTVLARRETYPGLGLRPTRYLQPGVDFWDVYPLKLETKVTKPMVARVIVNLFDFDSETRAGFPALDPAGEKVTPAIGQIKIVPTRWPLYQPSQAAQVSFGEVIALVGYDLEKSTGARGQGGLNFNLYWQSLRPVDQDYVVFVHLLGADGAVLAQADGPPTGNTYPTRWWSPGEIIADRRAVPKPAGTVKLRLGLYELTSGQRLAITESTLPLQDNSVELPLP